MGSHYGVKIRKKETAVLKEEKAKHECPKCGKKNLRRKGTSLWVCNSCGARIAGGSYTPQTDVGVAARKVLESL